MNELTDAQVAESLAWLRDNAESAKNFTLEQAPLYFQELIRYETITSSIGVAFAVFLFVLVAWTLRRAVVAFRKDSDHIDGFGPWVSGAIFLALVATGASSCYVPDLVKATTAPRVLILEHLTK